MSILQDNGGTMPKMEDSYPHHVVSLDGPTRPVGVKKDEGKLRFDLIPPQPLAELARVYTIGAKKYADRNWEKGIAWGRVFAAMCRHTWAWWNGQTYDPVDGQHHLSSVAWCAFALMEYERTHPELDDRHPIDASTGRTYGNTTGGSTNGGINHNS